MDQVVTEIKEDMVDQKVAVEEVTIKVMVVHKKGDMVKKADGVDKNQIVGTEGGRMIEEVQEEG